MDKFTAVTGYPFDSKPVSLRVRTEWEANLALAQQHRAPVVRNRTRATRGELRMLACVYVATMLFVWCSAFA
jgi:hypothetical protein